MGMRDAYMARVVLVTCLPSYQSLCCITTLRDSVGYLSTREEKTLELERLPVHLDSQRERPSLLSRSVHDTTLSTRQTASTIWKHHRSMQVPVWQGMPCAWTPTNVCGFPCYCGWGSAYLTASQPHSLTAKAKERAK